MNKSSMAAWAAVAAGLAVYAGVVAYAINNVGSEEDACKNFAAENPQAVRDEANIDRWGRSVFQHPQGHVCKVYPQL